MSDDELEAIRERAEAVPGWVLKIEQGPPEFHERPLGQDMRLGMPATIPYTDVELRLPSGEAVLVASHAKHFAIRLAGAEFLIHAPQDVHALLAEVDRLRQEASSSLPRSEST